MYSSSEETGVITAYLEKLIEQAIPRAMEIKKRLEQGERLDQIDIAYLEEQVENARTMMPMLSHHPEYQKLTTELTSLYAEISEQAMRNQLNEYTP